MKFLINNVSRHFLKVWWARLASRKAGWITYFKADAILWEVLMPLEGKFCHAFEFNGAPQ